ncbi:hypothetical protein HC891_25220 [Candidatus Gracilibacteria bacterium]|nr:hypothetical protein [Candidatus Gracilibacteria bacterium]
MHSVYIDLQGIGFEESIDQWFQAFLVQIESTLRRQIAIDSFWQSLAERSAAERVLDFFKRYVMPQVRGQLVLFIDEAEALLSTRLAPEIRVQFFEALRLLDSERELCVVLSGCALRNSFRELRRRSQFTSNIVLDDLRIEDCAPLQAGLDLAHPGRGAALLAAIFSWTSGHPYLTQQLCEAVINIAVAEDIEPVIEQLVRQHIGPDSAPLRFIDDFIRNADERDEMLKLYQQIRQDTPTRLTSRLNAVEKLLLSGLVCERDTHFVVANRIFREHFDERWIASFTTTGDVFADYERALTRSEQQIRIYYPNSEEEFGVLEQRLRQSFERARLYGDSDDVKRERTQIISALNDLCRSLFGKAFTEQLDETSVDSSSSTEQAFVSYEVALTRLYATLQVDHPQAEAEFLVLDQRLRSIIRQVQLYGDTDTYRSQRSAIISELNNLCQRTMGSPFPI